MFSNIVGFVAFVCALAGAYILAGLGVALVVAAVVLAVACYFTADPVEAGK